jgi:hypothetical protein
MRVGLEMGKQLVQVWDIEPTTGQVGELKTNRIVNRRTRGVSEEQQTHNFALECGV